MLLVTHANADPDAISSVATMYHLLSTPPANGPAPAAVHWFPGSRNHLVKTLMEEYPVALPPAIQAPGLTSGKPVAIIFLDVNAPARVHPAFDAKHPEDAWVLVDHHEPGEGPLASFDARLVDPNAGATAVLLGQLLRDAPQGSVTSLPLALRQWLGFGILSDTRNLRLASREVLGVLGGLLADDLTLPDLVRALDQPLRRSEAIARVKGTRRATFYKARECLVATTQVSAFEGAVANALLAVGVDVAFVFSHKNDTLRVTGRATEQFTTTRPFHMGHFLHALEAKLGGGFGGGHRGAGSYTSARAPPDPEKIILHALRDELGLHLDKLEP